LAVNSVDLLTNGVLVAERASIPLVTLQRARITGIDALLKGGLDQAGAVLGLVLIGPFVLVALARALVNGVRPLFARQTIVADRDHTVTLWLLRWEVSTSLLIRGAPALLAVMRGHLSLVGPRPLRCFGPDAAPPRGLTAVKPGLTGRWRLSGARASLVDQTVQDLAYVRNYTIWEDIRIVYASWKRLYSGQPSASLARWQEQTPHGDPEPVRSVVPRTQTNTS
jgi:lipopolysaccharide/colanic/teichoic acid biosynthesis glycosyltransferase